MIRIVKLREDRWQELKAIRLESLRHDPSAFGSSHKEEMKFTPDVWKSRIHNALFALSNDEPVGMITCLFNKRTKSRHVADIVGVYVTPSFRGRGVGTKLLRQTIRLARRKRNVIKLALAVNPEQKSAVNLYKSAGFVIAGKARKHLKIGRDYFDMLYMEKFLRCQVSRKI